jgi:hypothetical protein
MARFEIQIPDDHLALLENVAHYARETPEECLSRVAKEGLDAAGDALSKEIEERLGPPRPMGGDSAQIIREMRDNWPPLNRGRARDE